MHFQDFEPFRQFFYEGYRSTSRGIAQSPDPGSDPDRRAIQRTSVRQLMQPAIYGKTKNINSFTNTITNPLELRLAVRSIQGHVDIHLF